MVHIYREREGQGQAEAYYSARKKKEIFPFKKTWMNLDNIMLDVR